MESANEENEVAAFLREQTEKLQNGSKDKSDQENSEKRKEKSNETKIEPKVCRICLEGEKKSGLTSPCSCSGSCALVHLKCLELWLATTLKKTDECEICQSPYKLKIVRINPTFLKYVGQTTLVPAEILGFIIITIRILFCLALAFAVVSKTEYFVIHKDAASAFGISFLFFFTLSTYSFWIYTLIKAHIFKWKAFKIQHQGIKLCALDPENASNNEDKNAVHGNGMKRKRIILLVC